MSVSSVLSCLLLSGVLVLGCDTRGSPATSNSKDQGVGDSCDDSEPCSIGLTCTEVKGDTAPWGATRVCTTACASDADCASFGLVCGTIADGSRGCLASCASQPHAPCIDGIPTACAVAGPTECELCGCAPTERCEPGVGCEPRRQVGEPCTRDGDCNTDNCSVYNRVCRVAMGQNCTADNCDVCMSANDGWSFCSRICDFDSVCGAGNCLRMYEGWDYMCYPSCSSSSDESCHGDCWYGSANLYCDCSNCAITSAKRPLGASCTGAGDCQSGTCLTRSTYDSSREDYVYSGLCSGDCSSHAECSSSARCVGIPCVDAEMEGGCGGHCLPLCSSELPCQSGECRSFTLDGTEVVNVCDPRFSDGHACDDPDDCASLTCTRGICGTPAPLANGEGCTLSAECASNNCVASICRGVSLIGGSCTNNYDCSAGCCSTGGVCVAC